MINFFRKIRKQLANENKFQKYFRYAFGEVALIMIGIFMALQLNNWNENRKQEAQFKVTLEQIYNTLKFDVDDFKSQIEGHDYIINLIDYVLEHPDSFAVQNLPYTLHSIGEIGNKRTSETAYHTKNLKYNANNQWQNEISKQIINYVNTLNFDDGTLKNDYIAALKSIDLAYPKVDPLKYNVGWITTDSTYYSEEDFTRVSQLLHSNSFRAILKTLKSQTIYLKAKTFVRYGDGISIMNIIKKYNPNVKLLFQDVGIKGTAIDGFDNIGGLSTPMIQTDIDNDIWEIDIYLLEGTIKFRCRDSWAINWGGNDFPKGTGIHDGSDIIIPEAGNYHIIFKPITGEYEFIKLEDE